jgi:hypothetical protein
VIPDRTEDASVIDEPTSGWLLVSDGGPWLLRVSIHCSATDSAVIRSRADADCEMTLVSR